jgi:hypothetical protein
MLRQAFANPVLKDCGVNYSAEAEANKLKDPASHWSFR